MMPSDKLRLHVALYARGGRTPGGSDPATYHWALVVGPKTERPDDFGMRYHAKDRTSATGAKEWRFESVEASIQATSMILIRITVAKILKPEQVEMILKAIPVVQNDPTWNCITWVKNALEELHKSGVSWGPDPQVCGNQSSFERSAAATIPGRGCGIALSCDT